MKHYLAILLGAVFCLSGITTTAEAKHYDHWSSSYRHDDDHHWKKHRKHHHHRRHPHRVYHRAHYEWYHGHRIWVPGRFVVVFY
jgi:Ni/Co efflux regulator RcnB